MTMIQFATNKIGLHHTSRLLWRTSSRNFCKLSNVPRIAIVGSGPAGFYTAQHILKGHPKVLVDIYEKFPVPFGLVRYGVAPDHPDVKNVINTFTQTASKDRCAFLGNVNIGVDISLKDLLQNYTAVVLSYGADADRQLGIPGEDMNHVLSARQFVGWYNGLPQDRDLKPNLQTDTAVVLGHGNVALDVARILLSPLDTLQKTDITAHSYEALTKSQVKRVILVGRRSPLHVAFTTAELREMVRLQGCKPLFDPQDFEGLDDILKDLPRPRRRLTELMLKTSKLSSDATETNQKECVFKFLRSPVKFLGDKSGTVTGVELAVNKLEGSSVQEQKAVPTSEHEVIRTGMILRSIGYKSIALEPDCPFDETKGIIPNELGRVTDVPGLYCSGWVKRGPIGVIVSTMNDAFETAKTVLTDIDNEKLRASSSQQGKDAIMVKLQEKGLTPVSFTDWSKIDAEEVSRGSQIGKPREKIIDFSDMLKIVRT